MSKLVKLTNPAGQAVYFGVGWVIRPSVGADPSRQTDVVYQGAFQQVQENVAQVVALIEGAAE